MFDIHGRSETDLFHSAVRSRKKKERKRKLISERREIKRIVDRNLSAWSTSQGVILSEWYETTVNWQFIV